MALSYTRPAEFARLEWRPDRMLLDGLVFRLEHHRSEAWELGDECFLFYKVKLLVDMYEKFFRSIPWFKARNMLELGIWDGGSSAFWFEVLKPERYAGIDCTARADSPYFRKYIMSRGLAGKVQTYWRTDQTDAAKLGSIVDKLGGVNLVIDDGSHLYEPTKRSFEILFPQMEQGGIYIVEDWAWDHWPQWHGKDHPWANERRLTDFIIEIVEATGTGSALIEDAAIYPGFVAVQRGPLRVPHPFRLDEHILRRPTRRYAVSKLRQALERHVQDRVTKLGQALDPHVHHQLTKLGRALEQRARDSARKVRRTLDRHVLWRFK